MASEVDFNALRKQALATALAATSENGAAILSFHTGAEPKLLFACALGRLVSAFHKAGSIEKGAKLYRLRGECQQVRFTGAANALKKETVSGENCLSSLWDEETPLAMVMWRAYT